MSLQFFCEECVTVQVTYPAHDFSLLSFFFFFFFFFGFLHLIWKEFMHLI